MGNDYIYESDPAYAIQAGLDEYYDLIDNTDFSNADLHSFLSYEEEVRDNILRYCPAEEEDFNILVGTVHMGFLRKEFDINAIEDYIVLIINNAKLICNRRTNWKQINYQMECDEYEGETEYLDDAIDYQSREVLYEDDVPNQKKQGRFELIEAVAKEIYQYIMDHAYPVTKDVLSTTIPSYSDQALALAVSQPDILNYRGRYYSIEQVNLSDEEKLQIAEYIGQALEVTEAIHIDDIYEDFVTEYFPIVTRAYVQSAYQLFSFLEVILHNEFQFERPYISEKGVYIETPQECLEKYVLGHDEVAVDDLVAYAKGKHIKFDSILELIASLDNYVILKDRDTIIQIKHTGLDHYIAANIIQLILKELRRKKCLAIRDLMCISHFPRINVEWNEWLIYSVIRKWTTKIRAGTTSNQFRQSVPIAALPGEMTDARIEKIAARCTDLTYTLRDKVIESLDDIDDSILGYIDFDIDWSEKK